MSCTLFTDTCPDIQMNILRDVSFHLKVSGSISVLQLIIKLLTASANSQKGGKSQQRRNRSYYNGGKFKTERQTETGREGEPCEGQWGHRKAHKGSSGGGEHCIERGKHKPHLKTPGNSSTWKLSHPPRSSAHSILPLVPSQSLRPAAAAG